MDRSNSRWRGRAKVVAYLDLIFTSVELFLVVVLACLAGVFTAVVASVNNANSVQFDPNQGPTVISDDTKNALSHSVELVWLCVAITAILSIIELWAAIKLMNSTEIGRDHMESHRLASTWRNVCIAFLIVSIVVNVCTGSYIWLLITGIIRILYLYIVYMFMEELVRPPQSEPMTGISVKQ